MKKHDISPVSIVGNHVKLTCKEAFTSGQLINLAYTDKLGDGAVRMKRPARPCSSPPFSPPSAPSTT